MTTNPKTHIMSNAVGAAYVMETFEDLHNWDITEIENMEIERRYYDNSQEG